MNELSNHHQAIEVLQQLGLKEYEAKSFVALAQLPKATAKQISEISEVPRTRVYDAIRVLESKGLVEVQHTNPQQFRGIPITEAAKLLRKEYESRIENLVGAIENIEPDLAAADKEEITHEVWALTGADSVANRTNQLIDTARRELVLVIGHEDVLTAELLDQVRTADQRNVRVFIGTITDQLRDTVQEAIPGAKVFISGLEWLQNSRIDPEDETTISRLLLIDRNTILVSTTHKSRYGRTSDEKAVFGRGFDNGLVVIARRLMATGLEPLIEELETE